MNDLERRLRQIPQPQPSKELDLKIQALRDQRLLNEPDIPLRLPVWIVILFVAAAALTGFVSGFGVGKKTALASITRPAVLPENRLPNSVEVHLLRAPASNLFQFGTSKVSFFAHAVTTTTSTLD